MVHDRSKWKNALKTVMKSPTRGNRGKVAQSGQVVSKIKKIKHSDNIEIYLKSKIHEQYQRQA